VNGLFSSLSRYAFRQEENFLTETLVYLINLILEREKKIGLDIFANLCGAKVSVWFENAPTISISTQFTVEEGRPDIVIEVGTDKLVFIEVKHDSSLGFEQLERYYSHLKSLSGKETQLVLLTRSRLSIQETSMDRSFFYHVCWYEISGWLSEADIHDEVVIFLVDQFLGFLEEKEMSMEKVTWEYIQGMPAMVNLVNMLGIAIAEALPEEKTRRTAGWNWIGYYLGEGTDVWVGIRYKEPLKIVFENNNGNNPTLQQELILMDAHFFSLTAGEQLECLIDFVGNSIDAFSQALSEENHECS